MSRFALLVLCAGCLTAGLLGRPVQAQTPQVDASWVQAGPKADTFGDGPRQVAPKELTPADGVASNILQTLTADGDSLWIGPLLTVYLERERRFLTADVPRLTDGDDLVFSIAVDGEGTGPSTVWAGLAFDTGDGVAGGAGFLVSEDGGATTTFRPPPLDERADTTVTFGGVDFPALPVAQPAGSAPQDIAVDGDTVWSANGQAGLRRSTDQGETWTRIVLPPDTLDVLSPDAPEPFLIGPPVQGTGDGFANYVAFATLVDATGTVWAGTAGGLNRSRPQDVAPNGDRGWRRFEADRPGTLPSTAVVALDEQPLSNSASGAPSALWAATWPVGLGSNFRQRFGVVVTDDGGETFRPYLIGERIYDFAFRGTTVYAAGESGLIVSPDRGRTWRTIEQFPLAGDVPPLPDDIEARSVATTESALWVGTTDGLLRLERDQENRLTPSGSTLPPVTWTVFRTDVPVNPDEPSDVAPDVSTYAYPNPFSPSGDGQVRFRFELDDARTVRVEVFDFGMNRVRVLERSRPAGQQEIAWDGTGQNGLRLPNGVYFYTVDLGRATVRGKLILSN